MMEDLLRLAEIFDQNTGWFLDFLVILFSVGITSIVIIHIYRFATGKCDWMGRALEEMEPSGQVALLRLENCYKANEELEKKLALSESQRIELTEHLKEQAKELMQKKDTIIRLRKEISLLKELYEELDALYDDETFRGKSEIRVKYTVTNGEK